MLKFYGDDMTYSTYIGYHFLHKLQADYFVGQTMQNDCVQHAVISKMFLQQMYTIIIFIYSVGPTKCKKFVV